MQSTCCCRNVKCKLVRETGRVQWEVEDIYKILVGNTFGIGLLVHRGDDVDGTSLESKAVLMLTLL